MNLLQINAKTLEAYAESAWGMINALVYLQEYRHGRNLDPARLDLERYFLDAEDEDKALTQIAFKAALLGSGQGYAPAKDSDIWAGLMSPTLDMPTLDFTRQKVGAIRRKGHESFDAMEAIATIVLQFRKDPTPGTKRRLERDLANASLSKWADTFQYATTHHNPLYQQPRPQ
jgi:hypothetical protein